MRILQFHIVHSIGSRVFRLCSILKSFEVSREPLWEPRGPIWESVGSLCGWLGVLGWPLGSVVGPIWVSVGSLFGALGVLEGFLWANIGMFGLKLQSVVLFFEAPV